MAQNIIYDPGKGYLTFLDDQTVIIFFLTAFLGFCMFSLLGLNLFFGSCFSTDKRQTDDMVGEEPQGLAPFHCRFLGYLQVNRSLKILN